MFGLMGSPIFALFSEKLRHVFSQFFLQLKIAVTASLAPELNKKTSPIVKRTRIEMWGTALPALTLSPQRRISALK